jgi:hypothetical protein
MSFEKIVGREPQIERFKDQLLRIQNGNLRSPKLFEYYGQTGIGKTRLLHEIQQIGSIYNAFVDFESLDVDTTMVDPTIIIKYIAQRTGTNTSEFDRALAEFRNVEQPVSGVVETYRNMSQETRLYLRPEWLTRFRDVDVEFIKGANCKQSVTTILFDNMDSASVKLLDFVEEWVINPLLQINHVIVVCASTRPWIWKRPEIRRKLVSEELRPLSKEHVTLLLGEIWPRLAPAYIDQIYKITKGHPGSIQRILNI